MKKIGMAVIAGLSVSGVASAANLTLTFQGYGLNTVNSIAYKQNRAWNATGPTNYSKSSCGELNFTSGGGANVRTFCVQLWEGVSEGDTYTFGCVTPAAVPDNSPPHPGFMGELKASIVQDLYHRYYGGLDTSAEAAAFQIALYEITHENLDAADAASAIGQLNLSLGAFSVLASDSPAFADASAMLASLGTGGFQSIGERLVGLTDPHAQDQLLVVPIGAPAILAGLGLLGIGLIRRRK